MVIFTARFTDLRTHALGNFFWMIVPDGRQAGYVEMIEPIEALRFQKLTGQCAAGDDEGFGLAAWHVITTHVI